MTRRRRLGLGTLPGKVCRHREHWGFVARIQLTTILKAPEPPQKCETVINSEPPKGLNQLFGCKEFFEALMEEERALLRDHSEDESTVYGTGDLPLTSYIYIYNIYIRYVDIYRVLMTVSGLQLSISNRGAELMPGFAGFRPLGSEITPMLIICLPRD